MALDLNTPADNALISTFPAHIRQAKAEVGQVAADISGFVAAAQQSAGDAAESASEAAQIVATIREVTAATVDNQGDLIVTFSDSSTVNAGNVLGPPGYDGVSITSVARTAGTGLPGSLDTYTITFTDDTTAQFTVQNGVDGLGSGDVVGPASSVDGNIVLFDGEGGKTIKDSWVALTELESAGAGASAVATHESTYDHDLLHDPVSTANTTSVVFTQTGQEISADVQFGTGAGVAAEGNHDHSGIYEPADAAIQGHLTDTDNPHSVTKSQVGLGNVLNLEQRVYHGIQTTGSMSFDNSTHVFTLGAGSNIYWHQGTAVATTSAITCDLDSFVTLTADTIYFIYFDDATGVLKAGSTMFPFSSIVLVATVWWNGSVGAVNDERHGYNRDLAWHNWAHFVVGCRWLSGIDILTLGGTGAAAFLTTSAGVIRDEDIVFNLPASASFPTPNAYRIVYQTGATTYSFADTLQTTPFLPGTGSRPQYVSADTFALTTPPSAANRYVNHFVYATTDITCPIYILLETSSDTGGNTYISDGGHRSPALARSVPWPALSGLGLSPEWKPIYRIIVRADGAVQSLTSADDYRNVSSLPMAAGIAGTSANQVFFTPAGNLAATNVQAALEELDAEKSAQSNISQTYTGPMYSRDDDGTISGGTWAIDYANGPVIKATAGANITSITMANWPASDTEGHLRLKLVNFGAYTITFPASWNWVKSDLTTTTTFSNLGLTLPSSGTAEVDLTSDDGGTSYRVSVRR